MLLAWIVVLVKILDIFPVVFSKEPLIPELPTLKESSKIILEVDRTFNINKTSLNQLNVSSDLCQENPHQMYQKDNKNVEWLESESKLISSLLQVAPPFTISTKNNENPQCLADTEFFLDQLNKFQLWALTMYDASAKFPSGLLNGNVNQFGDLDLCLSVDSGLETTYCLAQVQLSLNDSCSSPRLRRVHELTHSRYPFYSTLDDPGHRVPRYSSIAWGVCVPASCSYQNVETEIQDRLETTLQGTCLEAQVRVEPAMCQKRNEPIPWSTWIVGSIFLGLFVISALATLHEMIASNPESKSQQTNSVLRSFSLQRNIRTLLDTKGSAQELTSVHGIRFINAYLLLVAHKSMALFFDPYFNRTQMTTVLDKPWTMIGRNASLYTDPFIMMSGLLSARALISRLDRDNRIDLKTEYTSRIFRLIPNLAALVLFCTFILPWLGSGPQWPLVITHHAEICRSNWWKNFLFIHNYFGFENICLTHTHHLGIDTQLFFTAPFLVYIMWKAPRFGSALLGALFIWSTVLRYSATLAHELSLFIYFGSPVSQMFRTANYSYILPAHRLSVYILGVILGFLLRKIGRQYPIHSRIRQIGWLAIAILFYTTYLAPAGWTPSSYRYDANEAAWYAAFAPITWCLIFVWIIILEYTGQAGIVGKIFSWKGFRVSTRLAYAFYLVQFPIFFYNVGKNRGPIQHSVYLLFDIVETLEVILAAIVLTLFVDLPFQNLRRLWLNRSKLQVESKNA